jgi:hypothetical protein
MTMVRMWVGGVQYKLSGQGYSPEGVVLPLFSENDAEKITASNPAALPLLNCLLGTSKQTRLQFDDKEQKFVCVGTFLSPHSIMQHHRAITLSLHVPLSSKHHLAPQSNDGRPCARSFLFPL